MKTQAASAFGTVNRSRNISKNLPWANVGPTFNQIISLGLWFLTLAIHQNLHRSLLKDTNATESTFPSGVPGWCSR